MRIETKTISLPNARLELKVDEGRPVVVSGYASTFGGEPDSYGDVLAPGAFTGSISQWMTSDVPLPMFLNHDPAKPIGIWPMLMEDTRGLRVDGELTPGNDLSRNVEASLRHKAVSGLSIGFRTRKASEGPNGTRVLEEVELFEISAVSHPANRFARVSGVKSVADQITDLRTFEAVLRDEHGFSNRAAKHIGTHGFRAYLRDVLGELEEEAHDADEQRHHGSSIRPGDGQQADELLTLLRGLRLTPA